MARLAALANFDHWYRDVPNVNVTFQLGLELTTSGNGLSTCDNQSYFPIDNQGYGNQLFVHNYPPRGATTGSIRDRCERAVASSVEVWIEHVLRATTVEDALGGTRRVGAAPRAVRDSP
jgi:hypothetical protein